MVIDERVVIGGSFNYTGPANRLNDENIFVLGDLEDDGPVTVARETGAMLQQASRQHCRRLCRCRACLWTTT